MTYYLRESNEYNSCMLHLTPRLIAPDSVLGCFSDVPGLGTLAIALLSINVSAMPSSSMSTSSTYSCSVSARIFNIHADCTQSRHSLSSAFFLDELVFPHSSIKSFICIFKFTYTETLNLHLSKYCKQRCSQKFVWGGRALLSSKD